MLYGLGLMNRRYLNSFDGALDNFLSDFFLSWPADPPKPPMTAELVYKDNETVEAIKIQLAVAGFGKDDIKVKVKKDLLVIEGSNESHKDITKRFSHSFSKKFSINDEYLYNGRSLKLDLEKIDVRIRNGILSILIPLGEADLDAKTIEICEE